MTVLPSFQILSNESNGKVIPDKPDKSLDNTSDDDEDDGGGDDSGGDEAVLLRKASRASSSAKTAGKKQQQQQQCRVLFSYAPTQEDELELRPGDVIDFDGEVEDGWWRGTINGRSGVFPSNFVEMIAAAQAANSATTTTAAGGNVATSTPVPAKPPLPKLQQRPAETSPRSSLQDRESKAPSVAAIVESKNKKNNENLKGTTLFLGH